MPEELDHGEEKRPSDRGKTALVFAGGGSLGAVQVGMLKVLVSHGVEADFLVGASVGAINGAYFAGQPTREGVMRLEQIWRGLRRNTVFPLSPITGLLGLLFSRKSLIAPRSLKQLILQWLPYSNLEEAKIPCYVVATDMLQGIEVTLSSGPAIDALLASTAIPGIFPPVRMGNCYLVDGGVANNTPISTAVRLGAARVIVLPTGVPCSLKEPPRSVLGMALHALNLLVTHQLVRDAEHFAPQVELIIVPPLCPLTTHAYDFSHSGELIERVEKTTFRWLEENGLHATAVPEELRPHAHGKRT